MEHGPTACDTPTIQEPDLQAAVVHSKKDYNSVADEIDRLRKLKQNVLVESAERKD